MEANQDELKHYGVIGMKWGVRRATRQLSRATTREERQSAINKLQTHRTKGMNKINKLKKREAQLVNTMNKRATQNTARAGKLRAKAATTRAKAYGMFTSRSTAQKRLYEANKLDAKAARLENKVKSVEAKINSNRSMQNLYATQIDRIDSALTQKGNKAVKKIVKGA